MANGADKRTGYGCLAIILIPIALFSGCIFVDNWLSQRRLEKEEQAEKVLAANYVDPFRTNAVVYSYSPPGNTLGDKMTVIACAENFDDAYDLMQHESDTDLKIALSLGKQLLNQEYTPESEYKQAYGQYVLDQQEQKKLRFIPDNGQNANRPEKI